MVKKINIAFTYCQQKLTEKKLKYNRLSYLYGLFKVLRNMMSSEWKKNINIAFTYCQQKLAEKNETFALNKESNTHK